MKIRGFRLGTKATLFLIISVLVLIRIGEEFIKLVAQSMIR
jgi:hypothetical protein